MAETFDVIIAGAGPAGAATAGLLGRAGAKVLLLDKARFPREKACGEYTSPETAVVLARIGALEHVEVAMPRRVGAMRVFAPGGHSFAIDYRAAGSGGDAVLATRRDLFDNALLAFAVASGADFRERVRVTGVLREGEQVRGVRVEGRGGAETEYRAPLVIGADGAHSAVARSLGLAREVRWPRRLGLVARYEGLEVCDDAGEMHVARHGYCGLAPLANGLVNAGIVIRMPAAGERMTATGRYERALQDFPLLRERFSAARRVTPVRGVGPVGVRVATDSGAGFILAGDAAGFFDPFTGEGVYKALRGAELATAAARQALATGDFSARFLRRYTRARRREFLPKDLVCRLVQGFVQFPAGMDYIAARLDHRPAEVLILAGVLGDFMDARLALRPSYLWGLLRP